VSQVTVKLGGLAVYARAFVSVVKHDTRYTRRGEQMSFRPSRLIARTPAAAKLYNTAPLTPIGRLPRLFSHRSPLHPSPS
jgi:hypothetical protein